jgi:16S rRNA processing protein RimM
MNLEECFKVGYIVRTHGLKGQVTAVFENEFQLDRLPLFFVEFDGNLVPYFIEKISRGENKSFLKFENINSLEQAETIKGRSLYLSKSSRPKLKRGQFYDDEILGFSIEDEGLGELGVVTEVQGSGVNRLITFLHKGKEILVPINSPFVASVNKSRRTIRMTLPDGYLEL